MRILFLAVFAAMGCFFSCDNQAPAPPMAGLAGSLQDSTIMRMWPLEIDSLKKIDPNIIMVDVRSELEYRTSHIFRAVNCDVNAPHFDQRISRLHKGTPVIVYDDQGTRSLQAAEVMKQLGFVRIYELAGGISSWARDGKTLVSGESGIDSSIILQ